MTFLFQCLSYAYEIRPSKVLTRLRIGHIRLTHNYLRRSGADRLAPVCQHFASELTVKHFMVECASHNDARRDHGYQDLSLPDILGDEVNINSLVSYLKTINVYYDINFSFTRQCCELTPTVFYVYSFY